MNSCIWILLLLFCCNGNSRCGSTHTSCGCNTRRCDCCSPCGCGSNHGCESPCTNDNCGCDCPMDRNDGCCNEPPVRPMPPTPPMAPPPPRPPRPPYEDCGCN
ncbi:MAG: solute carrier organic anion transporter [Lachnospiraceae bacterium]|nr:solute carrier organic anion transporter [Lachnospiraceae bacterium]MCI9657222.1 solute carrier organic anion transporter [Lachnospiraceae bacterium]